MDQYTMSEGILFSAQGLVKQDIARRLPSDLKRLSIVVPVYGSPKSLRPLRDQLDSVCRQLGVERELILVDDRCPLDSWTEVVALAEDDSQVLGIRLSRNFGQHPAIHAGLARSTGEWIVVMDCDLQDRPEEIPRLLERAAEGFDSVRARRVERQDNALRRAASSAFYALLGYLTDTHQSPEISCFGVYSRRVIKAISSWEENGKFFPAIVQWAGFRMSDLDSRHGRRLDGKSSYTLMRLIRLGVQVITSFSDKPLRLLVSVGFAISVVSFLAAFAILIGGITGLFTVEGWTSIMLSMWFLGGVIIGAIGLCGVYIGRILSEVKGRPRYIIDEIRKR